VKAVVVTPVQEAGAIVFLDVRTTEPLSIVCSFLPVLQPMWPAGIGGQSARWLDDLHAYQISEPTRQNTAYIGSPAASGMSYTPAHMLSDVPNQFRIDITDPSALRGKFIPVIMAGGKGPRSDVRALYERLAADPAARYRAARNYYAALDSSLMQVVTPDPRLNLAYAWARIAYDNLRVENPDLGSGLVAGLGQSGTGGRPGFGWFFGGDAYINSLSLSGTGAFAAVREALAFTQKWQREDGKMPHEVTQSAGYLRWFQDYPYAYIHGDTSPFYIVAMEDYVRASGDEAFLRESWTSLRKAFAWCRATDGNGDGLMDNARAGLGALEYGALTGVQSDVYTAAVWVRACSAMAGMARTLQDPEMERTAADLHRTALGSFRSRFWDEAAGHYAYAFDSTGRHTDIVSPWAAVGLLWHLGEPDRSLRTLGKFNSAELSTDWGIRSLSNRSPLYEPLNYNYGAVWPFLTSWVATAQYRHDLPVQGTMSLMTSVEHTFDNALGAVTEVFSGSANIWPQEAVSHQGFCTAGVVLPLVRGLLGLDGDALNREITFAPRPPAHWDSLTVRTFRLGATTFTLTWIRSEERVTLRVLPSSGEPWRLRLDPGFAPGVVVTSAQVNGRPVAVRDVRRPHSTRAPVEVTMTGPVTCTYTISRVPEVIPPEPAGRTGEPNRGLKIISTAWENGRLTLVVEGPAGSRTGLALRNADCAGEVRGADLRDGRLRVLFPAGNDGEFLRKAITIQGADPCATGTPDTIR
jgi:hypothetical protein